MSSSLQTRLSKRYLVPGCTISSLWSGGPQAEGRKIIVDAQAAVAANTATPKQLDMVQRQANGIYDGKKIIDEDSRAAVATNTATPEGATCLTWCT